MPVLHRKDFYPEGSYDWWVDDSEIGKWRYGGISAYHAIACRLGHPEVKTAAQVAKLSVTSETCQERGQIVRLECHILTARAELSDGTTITASPWEGNAR